MEFKPTVAILTGTGNTTIVVPEATPPVSIVILQRLDEFHGGEPTRARYREFRHWWDRDYWDVVSPWDETQPSAGFGLWLFAMCCEADSDYEGKQPDDDLEYFIGATQPVVWAYRAARSWFGGTQHG